MDIEAIAKFYDLPSLDNSGCNIAMYIVEVCVYMCVYWCVHARVCNYAYKAILCFLLHGLYKGILAG